MTTKLIIFIAALSMASPILAIAYDDMPYESGSDCSVFEEGCYRDNDEDGREDNADNPDDVYEDTRGNDAP